MRREGKGGTDREERERKGWTGKGRRLGQRKQVQYLLILEIDGVILLVKYIPLSTLL